MDRVSDDVLKFWAEAWTKDEYDPDYLMIAKELQRWRQVEGLLRDCRLRAYEDAGDSVRECLKLIDKGGG